MFWIISLDSYVNPSEKVEGEFPSGLKSENFKSRNVIQDAY